MKRGRRGAGNLVLGQAGAERHVEGLDGGAGGVVRNRETKSKEGLINPRLRSADPQKHLNSMRTMHEALNLSDLP